MGKIITMNNASSKSINKAFDEFQMYNKARNLSKDSIVFYDNAFKRFSEFFDTRQECSCIAQDTIYEYIEFLKGRNNNDITVNTWLRGLRTMINYFTKQGYLSNVKVKLMKADKSIKETYTDAELKLLLKKPDIKKCLFTEYRDWTIINYLLGTGNRLRTVTNLKIRRY